MSAKNGCIYDFEVAAIDGSTYSLDEYRGRALLVVNTASRCGLTGQFEGLEQLHREFADKGFSVLGFPCNQFAGQEPGSDEAIQSFCQSRYDVTFPMHSKLKVNGPDAHSLYKWMKKEAPGILGMQSIKWNFTKFLINQQGHVVARIGPRDEPSTVRPQILALL
jgi:glutathione peroxidase